MGSSPTVATAVHALENLMKAEAAWNAAADAGDVERMRHYANVLKEIWRKADASAAAA